MPIKYTTRINIGFFVAVMLICSIVAVVYSCFQQMNHQKGRVDHTYQVIYTLQDIIGNLADVQGSVRGFIITGQEDYLAPYYLSTPKVETALNNLEALVSDNPEQIAREKELEQHIHARIKIAESAIAEYRTKGQEAGMAVIKGGSGKREMDEIRVIITEMTTEERRLLDTRKTAVDGFYKLTMYSGGMGLFVCLFILAAVFVLIHREFKSRSRTEVSLVDAMDQMERHNDETKIVSKMGDFLRGCRERNEVYSVIAESIPSLFPQSFGAVTVFNEDHAMLHSVMTWGQLPDGVAKEFPPEDCWALRQGRGHLATPENSAPQCPHLKDVAHDCVSFCLPMQAQGETIGQIYFGARASEAKHVTKYEMGTMRRITEQVSLALANIDLQQALKEQSIKDPLTGLYNRRYLEETMGRELSRAQRNAAPLSLLIMDIDFFKKVNDTYGHDGGDAVLVAFAKMLATKGRKEDIACRLGGEEFVLVLPGATIEQAMARAEEICAATRALVIKFGGQTIKISVSVGVSDFPDHASNAEEIITQADTALYKAKQSGRDQVIAYTL